MRGIRSRRWSLTGTANASGKTQIAKELIIDGWADQIYSQDRRLIRVSELTCRSWSIWSAHPSIINSFAICVFARSIRGTGPAPSSRTDATHAPWRRTCFKFLQSVRLRLPEGAPWGDGPRPSARGGAESPLRGQDGGDRNSPPLHGSQGDQRRMAMKRPRIHTATPTPSRSPSASPWFFAIPASTEMAGPASIPPAPPLLWYITSGWCRRRGPASTVPWRGSARRRADPSGWRQWPSGAQRGP